MALAKLGGHDPNAGGPLPFRPTVRTTLAAIILGALVGTTLAATALLIAIELLDGRTEIAWLI